MNPTFIQNLLSTLANSTTRWAVTLLLAIVVTWFLQPSGFCSGTMYTRQGTREKRGIPERLVRQSLAPTFWKFGLLTCTYHHTASHYVLSLLLSSVIVVPAWSLKKGSRRLHAGRCKRGMQARYVRKWAVTVLE